RARDGAAGRLPALRPHSAGADGVPPRLRRGRVRLVLGGQAPAQEDERRRGGRALSYTPAGALASAPRRQTPGADAAGLAGFLLAMDPFPDHAGRLVYRAHPSLRVAADVLLGVALLGGVTLLLALLLLLTLPLALP